MYPAPPKLVSKPEVDAVGNSFKKPDFIAFGYLRCGCNPVYRTFRLLNNSLIPQMTIAHPQLVAEVKDEVLSRLPTRGFIEAEAEARYARQSC